MMLELRLCMVKKDWIVEDWFSELLVTTWWHTFIRLTFTFFSFNVVNIIYNYIPICRYLLKFSNATYCFRRNKIQYVDNLFSLIRHSKNCTFLEDLFHLYLFCILWRIRKSLLFVSSKNLFINRTTLFSHYIILTWIEDK